MNSPSSPAVAAIDPLLTLAGQRVLVTGASLGIGAAVARLFAQRGARLVLHHADMVDTALHCPGAGRALADELAARGSDVVRIDADLARAGAAADAAAQALRAWGGIDVLVLCASIQQRQDFGAIDDATYAAQLQVNLTSTLAFLQAVVPAMAAQRHGRVISIGSINQVRPHPELMVYAALKAAQHNLVVGIAKQHAGNGVTANTISPGLIATPRNAWRREDAAQWEAIQHQANPMHRAGTPDEVAQAAALLAAPAGAFITGADLAIDGGGRL